MEEKDRLGSLSYSVFGSAVTALQLRRSRLREDFLDNSSMQHPPINVTLNFGGFYGTMRPNWTEVPRGDVVGQWVAVYVTLNREGNIVMNRRAFERSGKAEAFTILFDDVNNRIGLKPTHKSMKNAYPVGPAGRHGGKVVRAFRLLKEFGIDINETIQFQNIEFDEDDIMILDLRSAKVSTRGSAKGRSMVKV